jgi:mono/diheme cytochrome c family protein
MIKIVMKKAMQMNSPSWHPWRMALLLFASIAAAALGGCESPITRIDPSLPRFAQLPPERISSLRRGREEYIAKCSSCHGLYRPDEGDTIYWNKWMKVMAERSRLTSPERERIAGYLATMSGR